MRSNLFHFCMVLDIVELILSRICMNYLSLDVKQAIINPSTKYKAIMVTAYEYANCKIYLQYSFN